jgi:hypothetical protein
MKTLFITAVLAGLGLLAGVGALFLFNTKGLAYETGTCDRIISYEDGSVVCQVLMQGANDNITVLRGAK